MNQDKSCLQIPAADRRYQTGTPCLPGGPQETCGRVTQQQHGTWTEIEAGGDEMHTGMVLSVEQL